jgi:hypothetical protein
VPGFIGEDEMKTGDLLEYRCPKFGIVWQWRIEGICLGSVGQESLIEVAPVMARPGYNSSLAAQPIVLVPEPMTRNLTLIEVSQ